MSRHEAAYRLKLVILQSLLSLGGGASQVDPLCILNVYRLINLRIRRNILIMKLCKSQVNSSSKSVTLHRVGMKFENLTFDSHRSDNENSSHCQNSSTIFGGNVCIEIWSIIFTLLKGFILIPRGEKFASVFQPHLLPLSSNSAVLSTRTV